MSKDKCKPILELLGNNDNKNISESGVYSSGRAQRQTYSLHLYQEK